MKEQINPADAYRLAQAWQLIEREKRGAPLPTDRNGKIVPSDEAYAHVRANYEVTHEIPPKPRAWREGRIGEHGDT
jgi:hypothetical protein